MKLIPAGKPVTSVIYCQNASKFISLGFQHPWLLFIDEVRSGNQFAMNPDLQIILRLTQNEFLTYWVLGKIKKWETTSNWLFSPKKFNNDLQLFRIGLWIAESFLAYKIIQSTKEVSFLFFLTPKYTEVEMVKVSTLRNEGFTDLNSLT